LVKNLLTVELWPERSDWQPRSTAIILEEQAVFSCMEGPFRSKNQLNLLAMMETDIPVAVFIGASSGSLEIVL
jgi:hypothetical protein